MSISKISRRLVVVIFVALIIFMEYQDIILLLNNGNKSITLNILKVVYIVVGIMLVAFYVYIKDKLYRKKIKRKISLIIRYIYMIFILNVMSIISIYTALDSINNFLLSVYIALKITIGIILKKIIFNISKSDILSVLGMFIFAMLPCTEHNINDIISNLINTLLIFTTIFIMQKLIDELKQKGVKTKKYLLLSVFLGILSGFCMLIGISSYILIVVALCSMILTVNLDKTHLGFPKRIIFNVSQRVRDILYKFERININKLYISILVITIVAALFLFFGNIVIKNKLIKANVAEIVKSVDFDISNQVTKDFKNDIINNTQEILSTSKTYYLLVLSYIVFIEILSVVLHRRYDTKSTIIKLFFILLYLSISLFKLDIMYYRTTISLLLILIAIINTSNIYLNREERVKMLVA